MTLTGSAGGEQTLTVTYTDTDGAGLIAYGQIIVNPNTGAASLPAACYLTWDSVGDIDLLDESQSPVSVYTGRAGQAGAAMSDGDCTVNPVHSSVTGSGTTLTVALAVTFPASFAGLHEVYSYGLNTAGLATGLIDLGAVEVQPPPDPPPPGYPNLYYEPTCSNAAGVQHHGQLG